MCRGTHTDPFTLYVTFSDPDIIFFMWLDKDHVRVEASDAHLGSMHIEMQRESAKNRGIRSYM